MCTIGKERFLCRTSLLHCLTKQCTYTISIPFSNNFALKVFWKWIFLATGRLRLHSPRGQYYLDFLLDFLEFFPARNQLYRENVHIATLLALSRSCLFILILVKILPARLIESACVVTAGKIHSICMRRLKSLNFWYFALFRWIQVGKEVKKISIGGPLSCHLTSAGRAALAGRSAGTG